MFVEIQLQRFFDTNYWFKEREVFMTEKIWKKNDPYLETREKEDAFADRIVEKVERKVLSNLPALLGLYVVKNNHSEDREE